jgi:hypothetical protein
MAIDPMVWSFNTSKDLNVCWVELRAPRSPKVKANHSRWRRETRITRLKCELNRELSKG